jgi:hypothetical protein
MEKIMKYISFLISPCAALLLIGTIARGATFTIINESGETVTLDIAKLYDWSHYKYDNSYTVNAGNSLSADTGGVGNLRRFRLKYANGKIYITNVDVGPWNVGGKLYIKTNGTCTYYFGVDTGLKWVDANAKDVTGQKEATESEYTKR